jgi:hypothetical protein
MYTDPLITPAMPTILIGGSLPVFSGARYQRGNGLFSSIARFALPLLKSFGKNMLRHGTRALANTVGDAMEEGGNLRDAALRHGVQAAKDAFSDTVAQRGSGRKRLGKTPPNRARKRLRGDVFTVINKTRKGFIDSD